MSFTIGLSAARCKSREDGASGEYSRTACEQLLGGAVGNLRLEPLASLARHVGNFVMFQRVDCASRHWLARCI